MGCATAIYENCFTPRPLIKSYDFARRPPSPAAWHCCVLMESCKKSPALIVTNSQKPDNESSPLCCRTPLRHRPAYQNGSLKILAKTNEMLLLQCKERKKKAKKISCKGGVRKKVIGERWGPALSEH